MVSLSKTMQSTKDGSMSERTKNFMALSRAMKLHDTIGREKKCPSCFAGPRPGHFSHIYEADSSQKFSNTTLYYFSIVKIPLRLATLSWATASSRLNTWHVRSPLVSGAFWI